MPRSRPAVVATVLLALTLAVPAALGTQTTLGASPADAIASDATAFTDDFEDGDLADWTVTTQGRGTASVVTQAGPNGTATKVARLTVPDYESSSMAYLRRSLDQPVHGLSAVGWFKVLAGGCDSSAGYSGGSVPFFRFFDTNGRRVLGLYRINGSCSKTAKLYTQHSGSFFRTGKNIGFGQWVRLELRATASGGQSFVEVYLNGTQVYRAPANNGIVPFGSVTMHNEHQDQVGDLLADDVRLATFETAAPTNPCQAATPEPAVETPGTLVVRDNFESFNLDRWSGTGVSGDGSAVVTSTAARTGGCGVLLHTTANSASRAYLNKTLGGATDVWADGWFNVRREGASGNNVPMWRVFGAGGNRVVDVYRTNVGGELWMRLPNGSGGYTYTKLNRTVPLGSWHRIRVHAVAATGAVQVWYDGVLVADVTGRSLGSSFASVQLHAEHFAQSGDLAADDLVVTKVP